MSKQKVKISEKVRQAIEQCALDAAPDECCGLLGGVDDFITKLYPLRNTADKPQTRYFASPEELFAAMRRIRNAGEALLGIYHSHPRTAAFPSQTDVELAFYPEANYFIISLVDEVNLRAFKINNLEIHELEISIINQI